MQKRTFRQSLYVLILSSLVSMLGALVDGIIIGRMMGSQAMAAYGFAIPVTVVAAGIAGVVASGAQSLSGKALAKGDETEANEYLSTSIIGYGILGVILIIVTVIFSKQICIILGANKGGKEIFQEVQSYILGFSPGLPAIFLTQTLSSYMHLENVKRRAVISATVGTVANCVGDIVNVLAIHGGMLGMGITTTISYYIMVIILFKRFTESDRVLSVSLKLFSFSKLKKLTLLGLPSADIQVCSTVRTIFLNRLILNIASQIAVSAFSIRMSMYNLYGAVVIGFGLTTLLVSSFYIGEENPEAIQKVLKVALHDGIIVMLGLTALVWIFARTLVELFSNDQPVIEIAIDSVRYFALSLPVFVINSIFAKYYQALGKQILSHAITIIENLVYICAIAFVLGNKFSLTGIWISFLVAEVMTLVTIIVIVGIENRRIPTSIQDFMLLPKNFGPEPNSQFYMECQNMEDAQNVNEKLWSFMEKRQASKDTKVKIALCAEELIKNVFEQSDYKAKQQVDLWVVDKENEWRLCLRDNGKAFNPLNWLTVNMEKKDCYGLRLVRMSSKDIQYIYTLNMNQILIKFGSCIKGADSDE